MSAHSFTPPIKRQRTGALQDAIAFASDLRRRGASWTAAALRRFPTGPALATETQRLASLPEQKQAALAALKKSLLHDAFRGAL